MYSANRGKMKRLLEGIRSWIDGPDQEASEKLNEMVREPRQAELFLKKVARELEACLRQESFAPPNLPLCFPPELVLFLSTAEDKNWLGNKRRTLISALNQALRVKVRELNGHRETPVSAPIVTLRVDGTLEAGQIRVKTLWDTSPGSTLVILPNNDESENRLKADSDPDTTHVYLNDSSPDGDPTQVLLPDTPLYHIEVRRGKVYEAVVPITQAMIRIGRGARTVPVDLRLTDANISRMHATLERDGDGRYWLISQGQNSISVDGREVKRDERTQISPNARIEICSYTLRLR